DDGKDRDHVGVEGVTLMRGRRGHGSHRVEPWTVKQQPLRGHSFDCIPLVKDFVLKDSEAGGGPKFTAPSESKDSIPLACLRVGGSPRDVGQSEQRRHGEVVGVMTPSGAVRIGVRQACFSILRCQTSHL
ncbi:hypothetical protein GW17_00057811, partial [Ensete ventricosum]